MTTDFPCHKKPHEEWCDRNGQADFMGHTCLPKHEDSQELWRGAFKLMEELGELQQLLGKVCACPVGEHWDGKGHLKDRLPLEIADVRAALDYFVITNGLYSESGRHQRKFDLFNKWGCAGVKP